MTKSAKKIILLITVVFLLVGCTNGKAKTEVDNQQNPNSTTDGQVIEGQKENQDDAKDVGDNGDTSNLDNLEEEDTSKEIDPRETIDLSIKPNEAGEIMVLMYHGIGDKESDWVRTPDNFKKDLNYLYENGYKPISLTDFVTNNITIEAGYTPVVITFDDGNKNNFNIIEKDGEKIIDPNCAVAILEEFHREHPDFPLEATFFLFGTNPFRQKDLVEYKLNYLVEKGFDIGNHTINHNDMKMKENQDPDKIQMFIGKEVAFLENIVQGYKVNTYALCNGARPSTKELEAYLEKGEYEGTNYENIAILNVGARPSVSPIDKRFNPLSIKRVRASEMNVGNLGMYSYLNNYEKNPHKRFISDGNPDVVTVPKAYEENIDIEKIKDKYLYVYEEESE